MGPFPPFSMVNADDVRKAREQAAILASQQKANLKKQLADFDAKIAQLRVARKKAVEDIDAQINQAQVERNKIATEVSNLPSAAA